MVEVLKENKNNDLIAIIFGRENDNGIVRKRIIEYQLENKVILAGYCECIDDYWQYADLNVLFSINDGFGLSIIEGYVNGVPSITFADLDAAEDVYSEETMVKIPSREKNVIIHSLNQALTTLWNKQSIKKISNNFSIELMAKKYINLYNDTIV